MCSASINFDLIIALIALAVGISGIRFQMIGLITSQLSDKARETNSYLDSEFRVPLIYESYSSVFSSIITAQQILDIHCKKYKFLIITDSLRSYLIDQYYLQLHATIRSLIQIRSLPNYKPYVPLDNELAQCKSFLSDAIGRYK
ncbi:MAG TPA: hypothetical protein VKR53_21425 [Puia sp.]|nr:hypothetical protein [Puia sp.]